ncbi:MAG: hypothetical protein M3Y67_03355 [Pseudomonadota bacterium]|nr:hypothetical protein [Pseudomonadota bacterium]
MSQEQLQIVLQFTPEDQTWIRVTKVSVPKFWQGHALAPALGDVVRVGGRQFVINARVWEHDGTVPTLRLYLGSGHAESDTVFG